MVASANTYKDKVSQLITWGHWFSFVNIIAAMLLGLRYVIHSEWPTTLIGQLYLGLSWIGHFGFLVFAIYILILFPASFIIPSQRLTRFFGILVATIGLTTLLLDTYAYQSVDLHLSSLVWDLLLSGEKTELNARWQYLFIVVPVFFLFEMILSELIWRKLRKLSRKHVGGPIAFVFGICFLSSHLIYIWADANLYRPVTMQRSNFPLSYPMTAKTFMEKHGLLDRQEYAKRQQQQGLKNSEIMRYPIEKMNFKDKGTQQNLLVIMIDSLRSDMVNKETMPNLTAFAQHNTNFSNNYSSSNNDLGVFGLLYGLPSGYANSIRAEGKSPLLLDTLQDRGYHFGLFSGENFAQPLYREAIFSKLNLANTELFNTNNSLPNDQVAFTAWQDWLKKQTVDDPWFSFLELTSMDQFEEGGNYKAIFTPAIDRHLQHDKNTDSNVLLKNSYRNAAYHVDTIIEKVLADLKSKAMMDNTVIVITSNHGTEFNEGGNNTWGSGSNYSQYQIKVPLIIHWPQHTPKVITRATTNLDVVPTLMESLLHITSTPENYSSGLNLLDNTSDHRQWILSGNRNDIVVIQKDTTTVIDKYGNYRVYNNNYQLMDQSKPKLSTLMQVMHELKRFYVPQYK